MAIVGKVFLSLPCLGSLVGALIKCQFYHFLYKTVPNYVQNMDRHVADRVSTGRSYQTYKGSGKGEGLERKSHIFMGIYEY